MLGILTRFPRNQMETQPRLNRWDDWNNSSSFHLNRLEATPTSASCLQLQTLGKITKYFGA